MSAVSFRLKRVLVLLCACLVAALETSVHLAAQDDPALWYETETMS